MQVNMHLFEIIVLSLFIWMEITKVEAQGYTTELPRVGPLGHPGAVGGTGTIGIRIISEDSGPSGATGATGTRGAQGRVGPTGAEGSPGVDGATGATGIGSTGATGYPGPIGPPGPPGVSTHNKAADTSQDINECMIENGGCDHICIKNANDHKCECENGYVLLQNLRSCQLQRNEISLTMIIITLIYGMAIFALLVAVCLLAQKVRK